MIPVVICTLPVSLIVCTRKIILLNYLHYYYYYYYGTTIGFYPLSTNVQLSKNSRNLYLA